MANALQFWASAAPTAIIQMLPQALWRGCAPQFVLVRMRGVSPGVPNNRLVVEALTDEVDLTRAGVPVPVLELGAGWLHLSDTGVARGLPLAIVLAVAAPLTLTVMRLVQVTVTPKRLTNSPEWLKNVARRSTPRMRRALASCTTAIAARSTNREKK